ncbi:hypothetical protein FA13DRAFT_1176706 [Coprinellus micaceus]|uniref:Uncharacterized protein n=1 Tax=Coprinellus micaceus TaxID=71717 RepID=A0A4Y7SUK3_COPMI|nr:hypothetical protein FA13DRAFT_1176706 [Coprinellus micaceus]
METQGTFTTPLVSEPLRHTSPRTPSPFHSSLFPEALFLSLGRIILFHMALPAYACPSTLPLLLIPPCRSHANDSYLEQDQFALCYIHVHQRLGDTLQKRRMPSFKYSRIVRPHLSPCSTRLAHRLDHSRSLPIPDEDWRRLSASCLDCAKFTHPL